jgi:hypothetical protein
MKGKCSHYETDFLGQQKGEKGTNRYFKCKKCNALLVVSEDGVKYEISESSE